jgi:MoaA/NifB/PqqE/SkfB family radical SAM enzyme
VPKSLSHVVQKLLARLRPHSNEYAPEAQLPRFAFNIDVLASGACNLSCPSCPVGNMPEVQNPKGMMQAELLRAILEKAVKECDLHLVALYNWSEPLLHPRLPELVRVVNSFGIESHLSTNLNRMKDIDAVLAANATALRISASGFRQETYGVSHRGGNIDIVKANMIELMAAKGRTSSTTRIELVYHRYNHNLEDEIPMKNFCTELGIEFFPVWAFMIPLEKLLSYVDRDGSVAISAEDNAIIDRLLLPIPEALQAAQVHRDKPCTLQTEQMTLDCYGNVQLCCATYDSSKYTLGNYLERPLHDFQEMKYSNDTCTRCMQRGAHIYYMYAAPEFEAIARKHAAAAPQLNALEQTRAFSNC